MTNDGLREVVKFCKRCPGLRVLKLFQNQLDDEGCKELVSVFKECAGLEELHLSHNWITEAGVEMLAESALQDLSSRFSRPFWLRVEHNNFSYASTFIEDLKNRFRPDICGREDRKKCSNRECVKNCRLHIPFLVDDKGARASRGDSGNWGRWNNHRDDWSYNYDYNQPQYKALQRSRSRSQPRPIRLTERQVSPPPKPKQRPRDRVSERSPLDRREIYYEETAYPTYPVYSNRRMRPYEPAYHPPPRVPRAPSPPVRPRRVTRPQPSPPRPPSHRRPPSHPWPAASGRRNRQTPMEPPRSSMQQMQYMQPKHQLKHQPPAGPVRRPPSPPKPKSHQAQYALPTSLPQAPVDVDGESEYSYDYYSDDYSYDDDDDEPPAVTGAVGHPSSVVVPPMVNMTREAPPPIPSSAPKARPPPRQPPRAAPRAARARAGAERHLVNRYEALRNPGGDRPMRQTVRRRAS